MSPRSLKIVTQAGAQLVAMNLEELREELKQYENKPVAVVSVAGKMRGGKSYLLNRFIQQMEPSKVDGFNFQGDTIRCTTGIDVWTKPYEVDGEDLVVLFMDTQGVFDQSQDIAGEANLVALSLLLSSVQIFNTDRFVDANDERYLKVYLQLAEEAKKEGMDEKFQKLIFLIRDFVAVDGIDFDNGPTFLSNRIRLSDDVTGSFQQIQCHLLPHPGLSFLANKNVSTDEFFKDFDTRINNFAEGVLNPKSLESKKFNGKPITCMELVDTLESLIDWFNCDEATRVKTPQHAMAEARISNYLRRGKKSYDEQMDEPNVRENLFQSHEEVMDQVLLVFQGCSAIGFEEDFEKAKSELQEYCQMKFDTLAGELKRQQETIDCEFKEIAFAAFEEIMNAAVAQFRTVDDLNVAYHEAQTNVRVIYMERTIVFENAPSGAHFDQRLSDDMEKKYKDLELVMKSHEAHDAEIQMRNNERQMWSSFKSAKEKYDELMAEPGIDLADKHNRARNAALTIIHPKDPIDFYNEYRDELERYIKSRYDHYKEQRRIQEEQSARIRRGILLAAAIGGIGICMATLPVPLLLRLAFFL